MTKWHRNYLVRRYAYGPFLKVACWLLFGGRFLIPQFIYRLRRPIFVVGVSRSGTTAFMELFERHRDLCNWTEAAQIMDLGFYDPELEHTKNAADLKTFDAFRIRFLFGVRTWMNGKKRFVNKHPENSLRIPYIRAIFPDAIFIHLMLDGNAVVFSNYSQTRRDAFRKNWPLGQFPKPPNWRSRLELPLLDQFAHQWVEIIREIRRQAGAQLDESTYTEISYEDLCCRTHQILRDLDEFCGLDPNRRLYDEIPVELPSQNYKWKKELSDDEKKLIEEIIGSLKKELGK